MTTIWNSPHKDKLPVVEVTFCRVQAKGVIDVVGKLVGFQTAIHQCAIAIERAVGCEFVVNGAEQVGCGQSEIVEFVTLDNGKGHAKAL